MKPKIMIGILISLIFITCIGIGFYLTKINQLSDTNIMQRTEVSEEKVTDECTQETEKLLQANTSERKVSPNAIFIMKRVFNECGHISKQYIDAPKEAINKTKEEIEEMYKDWKIENFTNNEIILTRTESGSCNEHYVLRNVEERVVVYKIDENNQEEVFERTGIYTKYLPETDKIQIENGIYVNGKEALNRILEDYE